MQLLVLASTLSFVAVGSWVGFRLVLIWRRTGQLPELTVGLGLLMVAMLGYPLGIVAMAPPVPPLPATLAFVVAIAALTTGSISIYVFTWRVFRPEGALAAVCAGLAMAALVGLGLASIAVALRHGVRDPLLVPRQIVVGLSYVWTAFEAFRYHRMLRKRIGLGLSDPIVANRFLLWGLAGVFASTGIVLSTAVGLTGANPTADPLSLLAIGSAGFLTSLTLYLAFSPPEVYRRWLASRTPAPVC